MANCCDEYGNCTQEKNCPVRAGYSYRKVRAGRPVGDDTGCLPVQFTDEQTDKWKKAEQAIEELNAEAKLSWFEWSAIAVLVACLFALGFFFGRLLS